MFTFFLLALNALRHLKRFYIFLDIYISLVVEPFWLKSVFFWRLHSIKTKQSSCSYNQNNPVISFSAIILLHLDSFDLGF